MVGKSVRLDGGGGGGLVEGISLRGRDGGRRGKGGGKEREGVGGLRGGRTSGSRLCGRRA